MAQVYGHIASGLQGISAIGETVAGVQTAKGAKKAYDAEAASELQAGEYNADLSRDQSRRVLGKQRAIIGAAGLDTTSGTPLDIMLESAKQAEIEALTIQQNARMRAESSKAKGRIAGRIGSDEATRGVVRGSTILSDWFNRYAPAPKKSKFSKEDLNWIDEANS